MRNLDLNGSIEVFCSRCPFTKHEEQNTSGKFLNFGMFDWLLWFGGYGARPKIAKTPPKSQRPTFFDWKKTSPKSLKPKDLFVSTGKRPHNRKKTTKTQQQDKLNYVLYPLIDTDIFTTDVVNFLFVLGKIINTVNNLYPWCRNLLMVPSNSLNRFLPGVKL